MHSRPRDHSGVPDTPHGRLRHAHNLSSLQRIRWGDPWITHRYPYVNDQEQSRSVAKTNQVFSDNWMFSVRPKKYAAVENAFSTAASCHGSRISDPGSDYRRRAPVPPRSCDSSRSPRPSPRSAPHNCAKKPMPAACTVVEAPSSVRPRSNDGSS